MSFWQFLTLVAILILFHAISTASGASTPPEEVEVFKQIATSLGKTDWDLNADPCSNGVGDLIPTNAPKDYVNAVNCSCFYESNTVCHITGILFKSQNLQGTLPSEFVRLPFLEEIDLTRNYLNGTIPKEWGSMQQLLNISLLGNRLSGTIPKELGNISTLKSLVLEVNQFSGSIPEEFGNLSSIERLFFTSNNLTGKLPETLAKLNTLKDFRVGDNQFVGNIPNFIENWINIEKLMIQGSGLNGPIPSGISSFPNLTDLRISDLNGTDSAFPMLSNAKNLKTLVLRSCNIVGRLPEYLGSLTKLKVLDLSFNKISGPIPDRFDGLAKTTYIYLTGNSLTGSVPGWMLDVGQNIDLSFNNLTSGSSGDSSCQPKALNLFASSSKGNTSGIVSCLNRSPCQWKWSFYINCGGRQVVEDRRYDADEESGGPSKFFESSTNWASSSTGHFLDNDNDIDGYIVKNDSMNNRSLYRNARVSPLSLTYYGFCLLNGKYTVKLHFSEIKFTEDRTYSSLGRRIFDIYIQGKLVEKDFNIKDEAGGVNKPIVKTFKAEVLHNTLEIRFYWAGRGTTTIPVRGVYGPLISAIYVDSNLKPSDGLSAGAVVGIVVAVIFSIFLLMLVLWWKGCLRRKDKMEQDFRGLDLLTGTFTLRQIKAATNNFDAANKIGEGGFGSVYKGTLSDGTIIAVKQLSSKSNQGNREFLNEIGMISALQHPNLVKLYGCCIEANQLLLVYEYMENNCLGRALFGPKEQQLKLDWPARHNIFVGVARGLAYLHEESRLKIVHRDIKATNVLLDKNLNPKISDFGLAKLHEEDNTHISTRIAGTFGYMAPEYAMRGYLTDKADVYSFGIVLLEIVSGKSNTSIKPKEACFYVLDWARQLKEEGKLMELVDSRLGLEFDPEEVLLTIHVALLCTDVLPNVRPSMSKVVSMLEGGVNQELIREFGLPSDKMKLKEMAETRLITDSYANRTISMSTDVPGTASSTSVGDLYPVNLSTDFWEDLNKENSSLLR